MPRIPIPNKLFIMVMPAKNKLSLPPALRKTDDWKDVANDFSAASSPLSSSSGISVVELVKS